MIDKVLLAVTMEHFVTARPNRDINSGAEQLSPAHRISYVRTLLSTIVLQGIFHKESFHF